MTDRDIALLLADAADGAEVGIAPTQAVIRGGRRRRARRWAVATAAALAIVGSTGTLALAGLPGDGDGRRGQSAASQLPDAFQDAPSRTTLLTGSEGGKEWKVYVDVWGAPRDKVEAEAQLTAMAEYEESPPDVRTAAELVGKSAYFVYRSYGDKGSRVMENTVAESDTLSGKDLIGGAVPLVPGVWDPDSRLVIGRIAKTADRVVCTWTDGTTTQAARGAANLANGTFPAAIRSSGAASYDWFVCVGAKGMAYKSAEVTQTRAPVS